MNATRDVLENLQEGMFLTKEAMTSSRKLEMSSLRGVTTGRNNRSACVVRFEDFRKEVHDGWQVNCTVNNFDNNNSTRNHSTIVAINLHTMIMFLLNP